MLLKNKLNRILKILLNLKKMLHVKVIFMIPWWMIASILNLFNYSTLLQKVCKQANANININNKLEVLFF